MLTISSVPGQSSGLMGGSQPSDLKAEVSPSSPLTAAEQRRLSLCPAGPASPAELRGLWRMSAPAARQQLHRFLAAGHLHVHAFEPPLYGVTPPSSRPPLPAAWAAGLKQLSGPVTFAHLLELWELNETAAKQRVTHLLASRHLLRDSKGVYVRPEDHRANLPSRQALDPDAASRQARARQARRLAQVQWPARLPQIVAAWQIGVNATNTYLHNLVARGALKRTPQGIYHLPDQPVLRPADVPRLPRRQVLRPQSPTTRPGDNPPVVMHVRLAQVQWPVTVQDAAAAWEVQPRTAAQTLGRLCKRGLAVRLTKGQYDLTPAGHQRRLTHLGEPACPIPNSNSVPAAPYMRSA